MTLAIPGCLARGAAISAADFDDYENITLVDRTREDGIAVTPASSREPGWLTFRSVDTQRSTVAVFRYSCAGPNGGRIEVWQAPPGGRLGSVHVAGTGGRYEWAEIPVPLTLPDGPLPDTTVDLRVAIHGLVRLDWLRLER